MLGYVDNAHAESDVLSMWKDIFRQDKAKTPVRVVYVHRGSETGELWGYGCWSGRIGNSAVSIAKAGLWPGARCRGRELTTRLGDDEWPGRQGYQRHTQA